MPARDRHLRDTRPGHLSGVARRLLGSPALYRILQTLCGTEHTLRRLRPLLADTAGQRVLDVGAGTGIAMSLLPEPRRYIWLDEDPAKLPRAHTSATVVRAILADATRLPLRERSIDVALCLAMSHHLSDTQLEAMLAELARVVRHRLVFLDALVVASSLRSRLLWAIDRGRHPRTSGVLREAIERRFRILSLEEYAVQHRYMLCTATPIV
jgi:ubiquinone/menaquinone biosynthesis C-methylase UbiE